MLPTLLRRRTLLLAAALAAGVLATSAGVSAAETSNVTLDGVKTRLYTDPGTTAVLVGAGILPLPVGKAKVVPAAGGRLRYTFPITTGSVDPATLAGTIDHSGGLRFLNTANGQSLTVRNFRIDTVAGQLTGAVDGDESMRVPILNLDLSSILVKSEGSLVRIRGVKATLTAEAAGALNATLGTSLFAEGIVLGTANVYARVAS